MLLSFKSVKAFVVDYLCEIAPSIVFLMSNTACPGCNGYKGVCERRVLSCFSVGTIYIKP